MFAKLSWTANEVMLAKASEERTLLLTITRMKISWFSHCMRRCSGGYGLQFSHCSVLWRGWKYWWKKMKTQVIPDMLYDIKVKESYGLM